MNNTNKHIDIPEFSENELSPNIEPLKDYEHQKLRLAGDLKFIREGLNALGRTDSEKHIADLMEKLADDRFVLAVLGQFKRGKSSLMNAIIGRELLPTGVLPLTSAITVLRYGPEDRLIINYNESPFPEELPVSVLPEFVTESGNPGNRKKVKTALIELPVPFLRRGVEFVDTPGIGSAIEANTATTYSFLPECDAVLFVTSVDTPMTQLELDFLKEIRGFVDKLFFIVNKIDSIEPSEQVGIIGFVSEIICKYTGFRPERIFPVSALMGLNSQLQGDTESYNRSGLKILEETLATFLSGEKQETFLSSIIHKALSVLTEEKTLGTFSESFLRSFDEASHAKKLVSVQRNPLEVAETIIQAWQRLEQFDDLKSGLQEPKFLKQNEPMHKGIPPGNAVPINIQADIALRECPVCQHIQKSVYQFLSEWQYQLGTSEHAQQQFAHALGFCPLHTWQLLAVSSPQGASSGFAPLANRVSGLLSEGEFRSLFRSMEQKEQSCTVCLLNSRAETEYLMQLASFLSGQQGINQYQKSQGVCLKHLYRLIDLVESEKNKALLIKYSATRFEEDAEDMQTYVLKRDTLRRSLQNRDEKEAYQRMIARMVGSRGVSTPWSGDGEI